MPITSDIAENIAKRAMKTTVGKATKVVAKGPVSSATKQLKGTLFNNKPIKTITKGKGDWRYIIMEDDSVELVDKSVINGLARSTGTAKKLSELELKPRKGQLAQAYKSLELHKAKGKTDKKTVVDFYNKYKQQMSIAGQETPKMSLVESEGKVFTLPKPYADILEKERSIKKLKDL